MIQELKEDNLSQLVEDNGTVIVQYSASWCGNCRIMKPKFKKLATENSDATFVVVDAEKFPESRKMATVDNLPTFAAFTKGSFVNQVQTNKFEILKELVDEVTSN
ncbi:thioredoxin [Aquimarina sp. AD10]|uniref:Thioredoxin n=1 Tax=Aquimarina aggregata TaxID=1642818 RepID=A0A162XCJ9_9FLAO|nr:MULTISPECIES: thioredoxin family protein [Aquimarina]AXT60113.1 thioredoxin [Aquimarina sp. AD10]KZS38550.1 thioredoxin [Aquimarina aggregata]RKN00094.1 thioredoxin [Aquimarina sp. AD10]